LEKHKIQTWRGDFGAALAYALTGIHVVSLPSKSEVHIRQPSQFRVRPKPHIQKPRCQQGLFVDLVEMLNKSLSYSNNLN
jgi:hypothetical protein